MERRLLDRIGDDAIKLHRFHIGGGLCAACEVDDAPNERRELTDLRVDVVTQTRPVARFQLAFAAEQLDVGAQARQRRA